MTQTVQFGSAFNVANVYVPDVYLEVVPPQSYFGGAPSSIAAETGTASWGPFNTPILTNTPQGIQQAYGGITAAALTDDHDLCTDLNQALNQAQGSLGVLLYAIRVQDGTATPATVILKDISGPQQNGMTISGKWCGVLGEQINIILGAGNQPNTINLTVVPFAGGGSAEVFTNLPNDHALFWAAAQAAINNGQGPSRGPSKFVVASNATTTTLAPKLGTFALSGGSDGRGVSTAQLIGSPYANTSGSAETLTFTGTTTTNDVINLDIVNGSFGGGAYLFQYQVQAGDNTLTALATSFKNAFNANATLSAAGFSATSLGAVVSITWPAGIGTVVFNCSHNGTQTATVAGSVTTGDSLSITVFDAGLSGGAQTASYVALLGDSATDVATGLKNALNAISGLNALGIVATSALGVITLVSTSVNPTTYTKTLSGGATETLTLAGGPTETGNLAGGPQNVGTPTGIYTLQSTQFVPSVLWCAGLTDPNGAAALLAFGQANNIFTLFAFAAGTDVPTAVAAKQSMGIYNFQMGFMLDWHYIFDTVNNQVRLISPLATAGGKIAALAPWNSPLNQQVSSILGTERNNPFTGDTPYSYAELTQLGQAGIMTITNPVPGGNVFAFRNGYNSVGNNDATSYVEYSRLTNFLANSMGAILGPFIGQNQSARPGDPLKARVRAALNAFLGPMKAQNFVDDFVVICNQTNNVQPGISQHLLKVQMLVQYLPSVQVIFTQIQGGTTVQVVQNQPGQSLVSP